MIRNRILHLLSDNKTLLLTVLLFSASVICMDAIWIMFMHDISCATHWIMGDILRSFGEICLIASPYWFAGRKWRRIIIFLPLTMTILALPNILYFRFWGDIMGLSVITMRGNLNWSLIQAAAGLTRVSDLWYLFLSAIPFGIYLLCRPASFRFSRTASCSLLATSMLLFGGGCLVQARTVVLNATGKKEDKLSYAMAISRLWSYQADCQWRSLSRGMIWHSLNLVRDAKVLSRLHQPLTMSLIQEIDEFLEAVPESPADSSFMMSEHKNVVLIVVESLNSDIIGKTVGGTPVTPTLDSLCHEPGCVTARHILPQIKHGGSSDGQILLNTGMLPPPLAAASIMYPDVLRSLPSLPRLLPRHESICVFATDGKWWGERGIHNSLGYDSTYVLQDFPDLLDRYGRDAAMFLFALEKIKDCRTPFLLQLITGSMHIPFEEEKAPQVTAFSILPDTIRRYYTMARYFDMWLGKFLEKITAMGLDRNTIVIVASDHPQSIAGTSADSSPLCFYGAFRCGVTASVERNVGQVNLFPTTLRLLGLTHRLPSSIYPYHGLGADILDPALDSAVSPDGDTLGHPSPMQRSAFHIADLIWRTNYFSRHP